MSRTPAARIANLDGLRAVSITVVFLFHAQVPGFGGGFLGVSLFFTLSGYLLGLRLADQPLNRPTIHRYWMGRLRRLLPLAWFVIGAVVAVEVATDTAVTDAPRRLWMTVIGAANWNQLLADQNYASLFASPDALVHYWSLAIEQQVYVLLPLILLVVWRLGTYRRRIAAIAGLACVSWLLPIVFGWSVARTYYGTDTRAGEILIGVALALTHQWHRRQVAREADLPRRRANLLAGGAMLVMLVFIVVATPGGEAIRRGLLPAQALLSVALVHVAVRRRDLWMGVLETRPFVYIGTLSYAIYLVHWPLIVLVEQRNWPRPIIVVVVAVATVAISALLVRLVEAPLRTGRRDRALVTSMAAAVLVVPMLVAVVPTSSTSAYLEQLERDGAELDISSIESAAVPRSTDPGSETPGSTSVVASPATTLSNAKQTTTTSTTASTSTTTAAATATETGDVVAITAVPSGNPGITPATTAGPAVDAPAAPIRLGFFGDSIALSVALVAAKHPLPGTQFVSETTMLGCSILPVPPNERCGPTMALWDVSTASEQVDLAIVLSCQWELIERDIMGVGPATIGDPLFDEALAAAVRGAAQRLLDGGVGRVAWMNCPTFSQTVGWPPEQGIQESRDPARSARMNEILATTLAEFGDRAVVIDLATWMVDHVEDPTVRPDGVHFAYDQRTVFTESLGQILQPVLGS
jgi:peptidoglycan/LPS O-acetylase OafA/YrhL